MTGGRLGHNQRNTETKAANPAARRNMTKHKVAELEGALLDLAVAKAEGKEFVFASAIHDCGWDSQDERRFAPSVDDDTAGPIIDREGISTVFVKGEWRAILNAESASRLDDYWQTVSVGSPDGDGPTRLVAAMRAHVKNKLGDEVDL